MLRFVTFFALVGGIFTPSVAAGVLVWEQTTIALSAKSTDDAAVAQFNFQNAGNGAVLIKEVRPDCSCVTVPLEKTQYDPGERGQVIARFAMARQSGDHTVTIEVKGNAEGGAFSSILILHVQIIDVVIFSPRFLYWKLDEPLLPKNVSLTLLPGEPIILREVRAENPAFTVKLSPTEDPRKFNLLVTPPTHRARAICPITAITEPPDHSAKQQHSMVARLL